MTGALRRGGLLLFAVVAIGVIVWNVVPAPSTSPPESPQEPFQSPLPSNAVPLPDASAAIGEAETREYAIALDELAGFPVDVPAGTFVELWVAWDRPSRSPKLQRLIPKAEFLRLVAPVTPTGPTAVVLRVPAHRIPDLLWADGYGALSVTVMS